jgi:hypothetical protein
VILIPLAIVAALVLALGGGESHDGAANARTAEKARACDRLTPQTARAFLGPVRQAPVGGPAGPRDTNCTYFDRRISRSVTLAFYPAADYEKAISAPLLRLKRDRVLGRRAMFSNRLGYLIEPDGAFYMQVTYLHLPHLHAERRWSRVLARQLLSGRAGPAPRRFVCSLTRKS